MAKCRIQKNNSSLSNVFNRTCVCAYVSHGTTVKSKSILWSWCSPLVWIYGKSQSQDKSIFSQISAPGLLSMQDSRAALLACAALDMLWPSLYQSAAGPLSACWPILQVSRFWPTFKEITSKKNNRIYTQFNIVRNASKSYSTLPLTYDMARQYVGLGLRV